MAAVGRVNVPHRSTIGLVVDPILSLVAVRADSDIEMCAIGGCYEVLGPMMVDGPRRQIGDLGSLGADVSCRTASVSAT